MVGAVVVVAAAAVAASLVAWPVGGHQEGSGRPTPLGAREQRQTQGTVGHGGW